MRVPGARPRSLRTAVSFAAAAALLAGVAACTPAPLAAPARPVGTFSAPASIPSDCSRDVTADLLAWIASVGDGSTLRFAPNGCYRIDRTLRIEDRNHLTFDGNGATFKAMTSGRELGPSAARTRSQFKFVDGSDILVQNLTVVGANPHAGTYDDSYVADLEAQHAFEIGGTRNIVLDRVHASDVYGDFVYVGAPSSHVTVQNSTFTRNGRQGWTVAGGEYVTFDNNIISETRRATIDMEPNSSESAQRHITFSNNIVGPGRLFFLSCGGAPAQTQDVSIVNNHLTGRALTVHVWGDPGVRSDFTVTGNTSDDGASQSGGGVIYFHGTSNVVVANNVQPVQPDRGISGVSLESATNVTVTGNTFPDAVAPVYYAPYDPVYKYPPTRQVTDSGNRIGAPLVVSASRTVLSSW